MIITILPNSGNFHAVAYNEKKVEQGMAELMEIRNFNHIDATVGYDAADLQDYLITYSRRNENVEKAQFHVSVSCKGNEYTYRQLLDIAHRYLHEMGYAEDGQPLLVYAHHDTPNNHIHLITSRVAPDGHKINHHHEKRRSRKVTLKIMEAYTGQRQEPTANEVAKVALSYRYTSKTQFCAILNSMGYETKEDDDKPVVHIYKGGEELGTIQVQLIMQHALQQPSLLGRGRGRGLPLDEQRRRQLRAILKKYREMSANKEELAAVMKKKFGISLVFLGKKDTPYGYFLVDHKNKTVYKGGEFLSIKELLLFEDAATRFAKISQTIDELLKDNPNATTKDINKLLYRQFGTRIHKGTVSWNGETIRLEDSVVEQLRQNYLASKGIKTQANPKTPKHKNPLPPQQGNRGIKNSPLFGRGVGGEALLANAGGSSDANREYEINGNMNLSVDNEETQRMKWRR